MNDSRAAATGDSHGGPVDSWQHRLRNELNTAAMACAASIGIARTLDDSATLQALLRNLQRAVDACERCSALLPAPRRDH